MKSATAIRLTLDKLQELCFKDSFKKNRSNRDEIHDVNHIYRNLPHIFLTFLLLSADD